MGKIYRGQTKLRIQVTASQNITGATELLVKYKKPNGVFGSWPGTASNDTNGVIYKDVTLATTLDQSGRWETWSGVTFSDGGYAPGEAVEMMVYEEGD